MTAEKVIEAIDKSLVILGTQLNTCSRQDGAGILSRIDQALDKRLVSMKQRKPMKPK